MALPVLAVSMTASCSWSRSSRAATRSSRAARSLVGRVRPVGRVEGAPGGRDGRLDLLVGRDIDLGDDGRVGRVDDLAAGRVAGRDPLAIDEQAGHERPRSGSMGAVRRRQDAPPVSGPVNGCVARGASGCGAAARHQPRAVPPGPARPRPGAPATDARSRPSNSADEDLDPGVVQARQRDVEAERGHARAGRIQDRARPARRPPGKLAAVDGPALPPRRLHDLGQDRRIRDGQLRVRGSGRAQVGTQLVRRHRGQEDLAGGGRMQARPLAAPGERPDLVGAVDLVDEHDAVAVADGQVDALAGRGHELGHDQAGLVAQVDRVEDAGAQLEQRQPQPVAAGGRVVVQPADLLEGAGQPPAGAPIDVQGGRQVGRADPAALGHDAQRGGHPGHAASGRPRGLALVLYHPS